MRRTPVRAVSERRRKRDATYPAARQAVFDRSDGRCEAVVSASCTGRCEQTHHVWGRVAPRGVDPHDPGRLLGVCGPCHSWVHGEPAGWRQVRDGVLERAGLNVP